MKKLLFISLVFFIFISIQKDLQSAGMQRIDIETQARRLLRDTSTDPNKQRWSSQQMWDRVNMGEIDIIVRTRCLTRRAWETSVTDISEYELPLDWIASLRVSYAIKPLTGTTTGYKRIEYYTLDGLDTWKSGWEEADSGYPSKYYYRNTKICIQPAPSSTYAGSKFIQLDYAYRCSSMTADADVPFDGVRYLYPYHPIIVWYVVAMCKYDEGDRNLGDFYWAKYMSDVIIMEKDLNNYPDKRGQFKVREP